MSLKNNYLKRYNMKTPISLRSSYFLRHSICLFAVSLSQQGHDILDFAYC